VLTSKTESVEDECTSFMGFLIFVFFIICTLGEKLEKQAENGLNPCEGG